MTAVFRLAWQHRTVTLIVLALLALTAMQIAHRWETAALREQLDGAQLGAIRGEQHGVREALRGYAAEQEKLQATIARDRAALTGALDQVRAARADVARTREAGERLVKSGTLDEVVKAGQKLGYHPRIVQEPQ